MKGWPCFLCGKVTAYRFKDRERHPICVGCLDRLERARQIIERETRGRS